MCNFGYCRFNPQSKQPMPQRNFHKPGDIRVKPKQKNKPFKILKARPGHPPLVGENTTPGTHWMCKDASWPCEKEMA